MLLTRYFADKFLKLTRLQFKLPKNSFNSCLKKKNPSMFLFLTMYLVILCSFLPFLVKYIKVFHEGSGDLNTLCGCFDLLRMVLCAGEQISPRVISATESPWVKALKLPTYKVFYYTNTMKLHAAKKK